MSQQTTRAAAHAWWVTGRPELNDLCPLQLILGQGRLAAGAEEPAKYQAEMLAEPWNKRYARLLDSQCMPDDEMSPATDNDAREALTDDPLGRHLLQLMRKHLSPVAVDHLSLGDEPTIGMSKLARALVTDGRSDGFRDCIDAIRGAIEFGKQDVNHAPTEHWLAEFWDIGRKLAAPSLTAGDGLTASDAILRARVADLIHLLQHATITTPSESDAGQAKQAMEDIKRHLAAPRQPGEVGAGVPKLKVFYGPMPESNGKSNFTAILYREGGDDFLGGIADGITLDRSEYPERVRYEADRARYLIGELAERPFILDYDADKHSGYVEPAAEPFNIDGRDYEDASAQQDERDGGQQ